MKKNRTWPLLVLAAALLPSAYQLAEWANLPAVVPTHFDFRGQADGFTSRDRLWLLTLALPVGVALLMAALPRLDPKGRLDGHNTNYQKLTLAVVGLVSGLAGLAIYLAVHPGTAPGRALAVLMGLFFALLGNYHCAAQLFCGLSLALGPRKSAGMGTHAPSGRLCLLRCGALGRSAGAGAAAGLGHAGPAGAGAGSGSTNLRLLLYDIPPAANNLQSSVNQPL